MRIRWVEEILHHLGWLKPFKLWDAYHLSTGDSDFATIHCMIGTCLKSPMKPVDSVQQLAQQVVVFGHGTLTWLRRSSGQITQQP